MTNRRLRLGRRALLLALGGSALGALGGCDFGRRQIELDLPHPGDTLVVRRGRASIDGRAAPGSRLMVSVDGREVGDVEVPGDGRWRGSFAASASSAVRVRVSSAMGALFGSQVERRLKLVPFSAGVNYVGWEPEAWDRAESDESLAELAAFGANSVTLVVPIYQEDLRAVRVRHDLDTSVRERSVRRAVERARGFGLSVVLKPLLIPGGAWRGDINPTDWDAWFTSYGDVIGELAEFSQSLRIDGFVAGTEMETASTQTSRWTELIASVRRRFSGDVYYFANYGEYEKVRFWGELEVVGIDAFAPLSANPSASVGVLVEGWRSWWNKVDRWRQPLNRRVFVGEVGFASYPNAVVSPWAGGGSAIGRIPDVEAQMRAYQATVQAFREVSDLAGVHWWDWEPDPAAGGVDDRGYTPQNKPAVDIFRDWFREEAIGRA